MKTKPVINYPLTTKDSKGNTVHCKLGDGYEYWQEFDENNNTIHYKNSKGFEYWREYDENNNQIHYKDSYGYEYWWGSKGNQIPNPNLVKEVTLDEIAEKFGISVDQIKIKK
jgi:hypothetical protein